MPKKKTKAKEAEKKEPSLIGKKLTMKMTLGTPKRCFPVGAKVEVGVDISEETARGFLRSGAAEFTSEAPGPSETK